MDALEFPPIPFDHPVAADLFEIERVRVDLRTEQPQDPLTLELRRVFQTLTSMMSARIEGNRTTRRGCHCGDPGGHCPGPPGP